MVYSDPSLLSMDFSAASGSSNQPRVIVYYNYSGIHNITGPVPFVSISSAANTTDNGDLFAETTSITLSGKIARSGTSIGTDGIFKAIMELRALFYGSGGSSEDTRNRYNNILEIKCDGTSYGTYSGLKIKSFSANPTPDNWTNSADYSIELDATVPKYSGSYLIRSASEDWTIEPLEEYAYYGKSTLLGSGQTSTSRIENSLSIDLIVLPQYKISRRLSAVGFSNNNGALAPYDSYLNAQKWVRERIKLANSGISNNNPYTTMSINAGNPASYFYNHLRTTRFSPTEGSYEVNDTWLAIGTGIPYIEDYSVDISTDNRTIKTVQVKGEVKGLGLGTRDFGEIDQAFMPTGRALSIYTGINPSLSSISSLTHYIPDAQSASSSFNQIFPHKYINAYSGWIKDIKPYLYRRACTVMRTADRDEPPYPYSVSPTNNRQKPNIAYTIPALLNITPISYSENHDPKKGTISYSYSYSNKLTYLSGVISESIRINDNSPADIISEAFVLGRRLGPALQNLGSRTSTKREVTIDVTVVPPASVGGFDLTNKDCPLWTGGAIYSGISGLLSNFRPYSTSRTNLFGNAITVNTSGQSFIANDRGSWDPITGRYSRSVSWIYQPCQLLLNTLNS